MSKAEKAKLENDIAKNDDQIKDIKSGISEKVSEIKTLEGEKKEQEKELAKLAKLREAKDPKRTAKAQAEFEGLELREKTNNEHVEKTDKKIGTLQKKLDKLNEDLIKKTAERNDNGDKKDNLTHRVRFIDENGEAIDGIEDQQVSDGKDAILPAANPEIEGQNFIKWDGQHKKIDDDTVITAIFEKKIFNVEYIDADGSLIETKNVRYGETADPPGEPKRDGQSFTGWDKSYKNIKENTIIRAQYITDPNISNKLYRQAVGHATDKEFKKGDIWYHYYLGPLECSDVRKEQAEVIGTFKVLEPEGVRDIPGLGKEAIRKLTEAIRGKALWVKKEDSVFAEEPPIEFYIPIEDRTKPKGKPVQYYRHKSMPTDQ